MSVGAGRWVVASAYSLALLTSFCAMPARAQNALPPAATPGGAQPRPEPALLTGGELDPFNVPRVPDRPLGVEEGPRVRVRRFDLLGAATQPNVSSGDIDLMLSRAIVEQPAEGYTVNQLQLVADRVTEAYRSSGLILAQAVVPAQDVVDGVVNILVMEGTLGELRFEGQRIYSRAILARPFSDLLKKPVQRDDMESALLYLTDYPGLSAFGVFQAGRRVGTTDLVIRTQHEERVVFDTTLDNQGSHYSGEYRANAGVVVNNPFGVADRLHVYGLYAFDPDDSRARGLYGGFDYRAQVNDPRNALRFGYSRNQFEVGQQLRLLGIKGTTQVADVSFARTFTKSRLETLSAHIGMARKDARFEQQGILGARDVLMVGSAGFQWNGIGLRTRGITQLSLDFNHGFGNMFGSLGKFDQQSDDGQASRLGASGTFDKVNLSLQRYQRLSQNHALLLRMSGQYSGDLLVSLEQFSLGGPDSVRAYPGAEFLGDSGAFASLEWIINAPGFAARPAFGGRTWGQVLQVSLFVDHAAGKLNEVLPGEDPRVDLTGAGLGLQLNVPNGLFARADVAKPVGSVEPSNGRDPQYFLRLGMTF